MKGLLILCKKFLKIEVRSGQRAERPSPEIFDPNKNLILNPERGPDFKFSPEKPGPLPITVRSHNGMQ